MCLKDSLVGGVLFYVGKAHALVAGHNRWYEIHRRYLTNVRIVIMRSLEHDVATSTHPPLTEVETAVVCFRGTDM